MDCIRRLLELLGLSEKPKLKCEDQFKLKLHLYENPSYGGNEMDISGSCDDLTERLRNGASSIIVEQDSEACQVFTEVQFKGGSVILYPGSYENLIEIGLPSPVKSFRKAPHNIALTLFETHTFGGNKKAFWASCDDLTSHLPEGASSIIVNEHSQETWQVFTEARFRGATVKLNPGGHYKNLEQMELINPVKSFRKAPSGWGGYIRKAASEWGVYFQKAASEWGVYFQRADSRHLRRDNNYTMKENIA